MRAASASGTTPATAGPSSTETCWWSRTGQVKINRGGDPHYPRGIRITGNVLYDHANAAGADMIDSVRGGELDITVNIFFTRNADQAQSFITLKRQVDAQSLGIVTDPG